MPDLRRKDNEEGRRVEPYKQRTQQAQYGCLT